MLSSTSKRNSRAGFTLIELSIVLFIIGLIVVAVMKGSGLYHRAEMGAVNQHFFQAWKDIVYDVYDRTGYVLGDMNTNGSMDAEFKTTDQAAILANCTEININTCDIIHTDYNASSDLCPSGKNPFERNVIGEFSGKDKTKIGFYYFKIDGDGTIDTNCLVFDNVPLEMAQYIDAQVDGTADAAHGDIRFTNSTLPSLGAKLTDITSYSDTSTDTDTRGYLISIIRF